MKGWRKCTNVLMAVLAMIIILGCASQTRIPKFLEPRYVPMPNFAVKIDISQSAQALIDNETGCFPVKILFLDKDGNVDNSIEIAGKIPYKEMARRLNGSLFAAQQYAYVEFRDLVFSITDCGESCDLAI